MPPVFFYILIETHWQKEIMWFSVKKKLLISSAEKRKIPYEIYSRVSYLEKTLLLLLLHFHRILDCAIEPDNHRDIRLHMIAQLSVSFPLLLFVDCSLWTKRKKKRWLLLTKTFWQFDDNHHSCSLSLKIFIFMSKKFKRKKIQSLCAIRFQAKKHISTLINIDFKWSMQNNAYIKLLMISWKAISFTLRLLYSDVILKGEPFFRHHIKVHDLVGTKPIDWLIW